MIPFVLLFDEMNKQEKSSKQNLFRTAVSLGLIAYFFSQQWITHIVCWSNDVVCVSLSVKYSISEVLSQRGTHAVKLETAGVGRK